MKKKRRKKHAVKPVTAALLILCAAVAGFFIFMALPVKNKSGPVFEEEYSSSNELKKIAGKIDHLLYESLYREGVSERDISFSKVVPRHEKDLEWEYTEISVKIGNSDSLKRLEHVISKNLAELSPAVYFETDKNSGRSLVFNIKILDHKTHRLDLRFDLKQEGSNLPKIAFIIDDIGYDTGLAEEFLNLEIPVCLSVLPYAPNSKKIASVIVERGGELLLHLPMEPRGFPESNPGQGALMLDMDRETIQGIVRKEIGKFPGLRGINHHMGSLFSEDNTKMRYVMDEIKKHNLYYVDSRTTKKTVAYRLAKALAIPAAEKSLFIDNDLSERVLKDEMERLLGIARYKGYAIGIGHPHAETLNILKEYTEILTEDYQVVPVSELVD